MRIIEPWTASLCILSAGCGKDTAICAKLQHARTCNILAHVAVTMLLFIAMYNNDMLTVTILNNKLISRSWHQLGSCLHYSFRYDVKNYLLQGRSSCSSSSRRSRRILLTGVSAHANGVSVSPFLASNL